MKALIQRVSSASVTVDQTPIAQIDRGILVLLAIEKQDTEAAIQKMAHKLVNYRLFADQDNKMNLSALDISAQLLVVSQFTLAASTDTGLRPSFSSAADPDMATRFYEQLVEQLRTYPLSIATGRFAADMQVSLVNDGPVTFLLQV